MIEKSNFSVQYKIIIAITTGIITLLASPYGISSVIGVVKVDIPWSLIFPIIISLAFGWRYGLLCSLSGAALFPFYLWPEEGYANIGTMVAFTSAYIIIGIANDISIIKKFQFLQVRIGLALIASIAIISFNHIIVFNLLLKHNPAFWYQNSVTNLPIDLLITFAIKDSFNLVILTLIAETIFRIPFIRQILRIQKKEAMADNTKIIFATILTAVGVWLIFIGLDKLLFNNESIVNDRHVVLAFLVIITSGFFATRMLFKYSENHLENQFALRESEALHRLLTDNSTDIIIRHDIKGNYIYVSPACDALLGYHQDDLIGHHPIEFVHPDDASAITKLLTRTLAQYHYASSEFRFRCKNGNYIWLESNSHFIINPISQDVVEIHSSSRNITNRKKAEIQVKESESKFKALYENANDAIFILKNGSFFDCNPTTLEIFKCSLDDIIGKSPVDFSPTLQPDGTTSAEKALNLITKANDGIAQKFEWKHTRSNGEPFDAEVFLNSVTINQQQMLQAIVRDITERKLAEEAINESEKRYKSITECLTDYLYTVIIESNKAIETIHGEACLAITGYSAKELSMDSYLWFNMIYDDDKESVRNKFQSILNGDIIEPFEHRIICKDGSLRWLSDTIIPKYDSSGNLISYDGVIKDITERKLAEEKLSNSEQMLKNVLDNFPGIVFWKDTNSTYIGCNKVFATNAGFNNASEITGKTDFDMPWRNTEAASYVQDDKEVMFENKQKIHIIETLRDKNNNTIWLDTSKIPVMNTKNEVVGVMGVSNDITNQKQAEDALKSLATRHANLSGKAFFEAVTNHIAQAMKLDFVFVGELTPNKEIINVLGGTAHGNPMDDMQYSLINTPCYNVINNKSCFYPSGIQALFPNDELLIQMGIEGYLGAPLLGKNNEPLGILVALHSKPVQNTDIIANYFNFFIDRLSAELQRLKASEELHKSEEKLSSLFGAMAEMVLLHELVFNSNGEVVDYRITDCNNAYTLITGQKKEDIIGKLATELYQVDIPPYLEEYTNVALTGNSFEYNNYFSPLDKHFIVSVVSPSKNTFATITTDITSMRQIQEVITAKNQELENYLYVTSHDLRSPLVNIQGFSQRLQKQADAINKEIEKCPMAIEEKANIEKITHEGIPKTLDFIFTNVAKMDTLINGLLQISRTGRIKMTIKQIDANNLFHTITSALNFQLTELGVTINIDDLAECYGDEALLNQLFTNIISNAIKYRDKKRKLEIEISSIIQFKRVIYTIKDNGIGISPRHLEKIWDVFYRVDSSAPESGEGIGLSLVKRITDKHRGKVWAESTEGVGTTFFIGLQRYDFSE